MTDSYPPIESCIEADISKYLNGPGSAVESLCPVWYQVESQPNGSAVRRHIPGHDEWSLLDIFWCSGCQTLKPRDPEQVVWEIDSYYCPHSLENIPSSEAMLYFNKSSRVFRCPCCSNILSTMASTVKTLVKDVPSLAGIEESSPRYYLACNYCRWESLELGIIATVPEDLINNAIASERKAAPNEAVSKLIEAFQKSPSITSTNKATSETVSDNVRDPLKTIPWRWSHVEEQVEAKSNKVKNPDRIELTRSENATSLLALSSDEEVPGKQYSFLQQISDPAGFSSVTGKPKPIRASLRTKQSLRCRECLEEGRPNILIKPQINPLKGDSSMRTNVGAWFKKDSHAYSTIPRLSVIHFHQTADGIASVYILVTNPVDTAMLVAFREAELGPSPVDGTIAQNAATDFKLPTGWVRLNAYDELEILDKQWSKSDAKDLGLNKDDDPDFVKERMNHKLVIKLQCSLNTSNLDGTSIARIPLDVAVVLIGEEDEDQVGEAEQQRYNFGLCIDILPVIEF